MNTDIQRSILNSFLTRCNKLTVGKSTKDKFYGRVTLRKSADLTKYNSKINRYGITAKGNGTRKFYVSGSKMINDGTYTLTGLRKALSEVI